MNEYRKSNILCDIKLIGETAKYSAHKAVLASFSKYFETMFLSQFVEAEQSAVKIPPAIVPWLEEDILNFAYTHSIDLSEDNIEAVLSAASFLQAEKLAEICSTYLGKNINTDNCLSIYKIAKKYDCCMIEIKAKEYCSKHFNKLVIHDDFLELNTHEFVEIISDDQINLESDELLNQAVDRWLNHRPRERDEVSSMVQFYVRRAGSEPFVPVLVVQGRYLNTQTDSLLFFSDNGLLVHDTDSVISNDEIDALSLSSDKTTCCAASLGSLWQCDLNSNNFTKMPDVSIPRTEFELVELDGLWYAIGGLYQDLAFRSERFLNRVDEALIVDISDAVERYDSTTKKWTQVADITEVVLNPAVVTLHGNIYVIGGKTERNEKSDRMQRYNPETNSWSQLTPHPRPTPQEVDWFHPFLTDGQPSACVLDDRIYVYPRTYHPEERRMFLYDPATNAWGNCVSVPGYEVDDPNAEPDLSWFDKGPVALNGNLYFLSRVSIINCNEICIKRYSPASDSWKTVCNLPKSFDPDIFLGPMLIKRPRRLCRKKN